MEEIKISVVAAELEMFCKTFQVKMPEDQFDNVFKTQEK